MASAEGNYCHINKLNDWCLLGIFMKLPVRDRLRMERVCKRWKEISEKSWSGVQEMEIFDREWKIKSNSWRELVGQNSQKIISLCGSYLLRLRVLFTYPFRNVNATIEQIATHCCNLTTLDFYSETCAIPYLNRIFLSCQNLENIHLDISKSFMNSTFLEDLVMCFQKLNKDRMKQIKLIKFDDPVVLPSSFAELLRDCRNLHTLLLKKISFDLRSLETFPITQSLRKIELHNWRWNDSFNAIYNLKNLEYLILKDIDPIPEEFFGQLAVHCQKLKYIDVGFTKDIYYEDRTVNVSELGKLPDLEVLRINCESIKYIVFGNIMSMMPNLKIFECYFEIYNFRTMLEYDMVSLLKHSKKLEYLYIKGGHSVTKRILEVATTITRERTDNRVLTLCLDYKLTSESRAQYHSPLLNIKYVR